MELLAIAVLLIAAIAFLVLAWAAAVFGAAGVWTVVGVVVTIVAMVLLARMNKRHVLARHEAAAAAENEAWIREFPSEVRHVVRILTDPWQACALWSQLNLGTEPNPLQGEPGRWPKLEPSQSSTPPDRGIWPVPIGARVRLRMVPGYAPKDYIAKVEHLATALDVDAVKVVAAQGRMLCLDLRTTDPLVEALPVPMPADDVDLGDVMSGLREDGEIWRVPLLYRNILGVGVPGAGKSGFLRSMLVATAPAACDGILVNLMIDLKFGVEAAAAKGLLHKTATSESSALKMLRWLRYELVERRGRYMEAHGIDKWVPTPDAPAYHLIIDEIAELLDNPETRKEFLRLLISIMRLGRALAFSVSAYTQLPNKQVLGMLRDLFQIRIGMRLTSPEQIAMTYGDHSVVERGAANTSIPDQGAEGVAYVVDEGSSEVVRVRAYHVTTANLAWFAERFPPAPHPELLDDAVVEAAAANTAGGERAEKVVPMRKKFGPAVPPALNLGRRVAESDDHDEAMAVADALDAQMAAVIAAENTQKTGAVIDADDDEADDDLDDDGDFNESA